MVSSSKSKDRSEVRHDDVGPLGVDKVETARQENAAKRKAAEEEAELKRKKKREAEIKLLAKVLLEQQEASNAFLNELDEKIDRVDVELKRRLRPTSSVQLRKKSREGKFGDWLGGRSD